ncbi:MAG: hypothetical protein COV75_08350 [Candidatus Omnitrophica bacterium CG11_big_fil_rev_8_21_14_0_20_63_9]|nr:MAG: hypothetical protein COV75_08350 [Candidatus Omnitrophica bacterium CG11_big_fil_rev_8_21_14_0_20_63_9]
MTWKTTLLLLLITLGIGTYIAVYEIKQPSREEQQARSQLVANIPAEQATHIVLDMPDAKTTLTKQETGWRLPQELRADPAAVHQLLFQLSPLHAVRTLAGTAEQSLDVATYGLAPALGRLSVSAEGHTTTLLFGHPTPVQSNRYAKLEDRPDIFVISNELFTQANRPLEQLRDPFLLRLDPWTTQELAITTAQQQLVLARQDQEWMVMQPLKDRADQSVVNQLLAALERLSVSRFLDDDPQIEQLSSWGFDHPYAEIMVRQEDAPAVTLFIGGTLPDDPARRYAKRGDERALYAVLMSELEGVLAQPDEVRAKQCVEFFSNTLSSVSVTNAGQSWTLEREHGTWRVAGTDTLLPNERMDAWLQRLLEVRVIRFIDDAPADLARYGLAAPSGMIAVSTSDGRPGQRLLVGGMLDGSLDRYGRIEGREAVVALPAGVSELLATTLQQLAAAAPATP